MAKVRSWAVWTCTRAVVLAVTSTPSRASCVRGGCRARPREVVAFCAGLPGPMRVAYEAGPTGYGLARALHAAGVDCVVAAPGKIERPAQDRVKTDRRDAERLVRLLMIDGAARGPGPEQPRRRRCATWSARARTCAAI